MKIPKRELKRQNELLELVKSDRPLTEDEVELIYEEWNPATIDSISMNGVYFTPYGLAQDLAVFCQARGNVVDIAAGIGMLSYRVKQMDTYNKYIKSITCIELNPEFVKIGKRLLPEANWICGSIYDKSIWDKIVKDLPGNRFDDAISNPPFGQMGNGEKISWLNYSGHRDLMALELCLRYSQCGQFILPSGSVPFRYSGRQRYEDNPERFSQKLKKFIKDNKDIPFQMMCDGIDTAFYKDEWKNLPGGIGCEVANIQIYPYTLCDKEDALINNLIKK